MSHEPVELRPTILSGITGSGDVTIKLGWQQYPYDIFPSVDGSRMLLRGMDHYEIYYKQSTCPDAPWKEGRIFKQTKLGYIKDLNDGASGREVYLHTKATKSVLSDFLDVYLGCLAVAGGPLSYLITGMGVAVSFGKLKQEIPLYCDALEAFVSNDFELRRAMPTFHEMMYVELFLSRIEADVKAKAFDLLKDSIPANKAVKGLVGVFLGKIGEDPMKRLLGGTRDIIRDVLLKTIDRVTATGAPLSQDQIYKLAFHHIGPMYRKMSNTPVSDTVLQQRGEAVIKEAAKAAGSIRSRLVKIADACDKLAG